MVRGNGGCVGPGGTVAGALGGAGAGGATTAGGPLAGACGAGGGGGGTGAAVVVVAVAVIVGRTTPAGSTGASRSTTTTAVTATVTAVTAIALSATARAAAPWPNTTGARFTATALVYVGSPRVARTAPAEVLQRYPVHVRWAFLAGRPVPRRSPADTPRCTAVHAAAVAVMALTVLTAACGKPTPPTASSTPAAAAPSSAPSAPARAPLTISTPYTPTIDPAAFSTRIDNPYLPLTPGTRTTYQSDTSDGQQTTRTEVTRDTKMVMGVDTVVVHDTVTVNGVTNEDTYDWYAQDRDGNVWYFGEDTKAFNGGAVDTTGSFLAGVHGALPGIVMPGIPQVGDHYRQEYARGVAEDVGEVLSLTGSETTPLTGPTTALLVTKDTDLLDPTGPAENKYYARGIGLILTVQTSGPPEREQAVTTEKF